MKIFFAIISVVFAKTLSAQPYLDVINISYTKNASQPEYYNASSNFPFQSKNKKTTAILSPYIESWMLKLSLPGINRNNTGYGIPVTLLQTLKNDKWQAVASIIFRDNDLHNYSGKEQWGGAFLVTYKAKPSLTYKAGLYYNSEYFGNFFVPLLGINWKINDRTTLFGILPGSMTIEHKSGKQFYIGSSFKAVTTSFMLPDKKYLRIDDNQLSGFADFYFFKNIVITAEAGHSIYRKLQYGTEKETAEKLPFRDQLFFSAQAAYRIRLSKQ